MRVLFVCLGNICRSPTAEGVFRARAASRGLSGELVIDSAGTAAYHEGEPPDARAQEHARRRGVDLSSLRARQITPRDFTTFDRVLVMDRANLADVRALAARHAATAEIALFLDGVDGVDVDEVPDPYYGGAAGFERVLDLCAAASDALLDDIVALRRR